MFTNEKVETPYELKGQTMASEHLWDNWMEEMGIIPMYITKPDFYTALEQGVVDGMGNAIDNIIPGGLEKVTKYIIQPGVFQGNGVHIINLETWNNLPSDLQDLIMDIQIEIEGEMEEYFDKLLGDQMQLCLDAGMELIKFSPEDAKYYRDLAYETEWEVNLEKYPEIAAKMQELTSK
jgi:TRAP-type C4-dicarboxylate transport system substrate-binding protein